MRPQPKGEQTEQLDEKSLDELEKRTEAPIQMPRWTPTDETDEEE